MKTVVCLPQHFTTESVMPLFTSMIDEVSSQVTPAQLAFFSNVVLLAGLLCCCNVYLVKACICMQTYFIHFVLER